MKESDIDDVTDENLIITAGNIIDNTTSYNDVEISGALVDNFNEKLTGVDLPQNFGLKKYMVSIMKEFIRAERMGEWQAH